MDGTPLMVVSAFATAVVVLPVLLLVLGFQRAQVPLSLRLASSGTDLAWLIG